MEREVLKKAKGRNNGLLHRERYGARDDGQTVLRSRLSAVRPARRLGLGLGMVLLYREHFCAGVLLWREIFEGLLCSRSLD